MTVDYCSKCKFFNGEKNICLFDDMDKNQPIKDIEGCYVPFMDY